MVQTMTPGSVIVDVAVDQGGCVETTRETTHTDPIYVVHGVVHYAVANMPGAVPHTSTYALTNATLPYVVELAGGVASSIQRDTALRGGLTTVAGKVTNEAVGSALGVDVTDPVAAFD
jgi:alanine dehydrogenase